MYSHYLNDRKVRVLFNRDPLQALLGHLVTARCRFSPRVPYFLCGHSYSNMLILTYISMDK